MMEPLALTGNYKLAAAIVLGILLGALLIKAELASRKKILDGLRFHDSTILCTFLFSIAAGAGLFFLASKYGLVGMHVRPAYFWGALSGGIIAGLGVAFCGSVPMTAVAELASGKLTALWTICGFLLAIPAVKAAAKVIDNLMRGWNRPLSSGVPVTMALFWTVIVCLTIAFLVHFSLSGGGSSSETPKKTKK